MISQKQNRLIQVAKAQLKLKDDEYREILMSVCKVKSSKDIRSLDDFRQLIKAFEKLGFEPKVVFENLAKRKRLTDRTISKEQIALIETLWQKVTKTPEIWRESLNSFLAARFNALNVESLSGMKAINVIEALKDMLLKTALMETHKSLGGGEGIVQNRIIEIFKTVKMCFTDEELAAVCASMFYSQPQVFERCKIAAAQFQSKMSHQSTGEEIPF